MGGQSAEALRRLQGGVRYPLPSPALSSASATHCTMGNRDDEYDYLFKGTARRGRAALLSGSAAAVGPARFGPALPGRSPAARALRRRCEGAALPARPRPAGLCGP